MKELVFALEFKGSAAPVPGSDNKLRAKTSATGQTLRSVVKPDGVQAAIEPAGGDSATFESEVDIVGEGSFLESGSIKYGSAGKVTFKTVGRGVLGPSPLAGIQRRSLSIGMRQRVRKISVGASSRRSGLAVLMT